jgi:hypothetical protein
MAQSSSAAPIAAPLPAPSMPALPALSPPRAILFGGLAVGVLDGMDAVLFFGARGVPAPRIFQGIASGLLGPASFRGGAATALLGVVLHFTIALGIVAVYVAASRRWTALARRPLAFGPLYGLAAYAVMNGIVLPLSAVAAGGPKPLPVLVNGLLIHMIGVGLPAALFARAALRPSMR